MTTPDYPDFTQGVGILERFTVLAHLAQIVTGNSSPTYDVSRYASLSFAIENPATGVAGQRYALRLEWGDGNSVTRTDVHTFHSTDSYPWLGGLALDVPVSGTTLTVYLYGPAGVTMTYEMLGSTRQIQERSIRPFGASYQPLNGPQVNQAVAISSTLTGLYFPPVTRALTISMAGGATQLTYRLFGVNLNAGTPNAVVLGEWAPGATALTVANFPAPMTGLELQVINSDSAAAHTAVCRIWDVS